jgi:hypothetical protein
MTPTMRTGLGTTISSKSARESERSLSLFWMRWKSLVKWRTWFYKV